MTGKANIVVMTKNNIAPIKNDSNAIEVFDCETLVRNKQRAAKNIENHNFLFNWALDNTHDRLEIIKRDFPQTALIGARHSKTVAERIKIGKNIRNLTILDTSPSLLDQQTETKITITEEFLPLPPQSLDMIISNLELHSINDVPGMLIQIKQALKPDGLFIATLFGGDTLTELRQCIAQAEVSIYGGISPHIFPFADKQQMGSVMQRAGFALPVIDSDIITVTYNDIFKLMTDIRGMGEGNAVKARDKKPLSRAVLMEAARLYQERFSDPDGRIRATFEIIFLLGWAPHDSQQKPLRPGSAKTELATALGTTEIGTGEEP